MDRHSGVPLKMLLPYHVAKKKNKSVGFADESEEPRVRVFTDK